MRRLLVGLVMVITQISLSADTLVVIGVVVNKAGQRVGGAKVLLLPTAKTGKALTDDTASDRGVFNLYQTNIGGDFGDLYVVYQGVGVAEPVRVKLSAPRDGVREARTADVIVLDSAAKLTLEEATERATAVAKTQALLVHAGVKDADAAKRAVEEATADFMRRVPAAERKEQSIKKLTESEMKGLTLPTPDITNILKGSIEKGVEKATPGRGGRGGL